MAERILGPQGSKRRRRFLWVPMIAIAALALFVIGNAQAVHDETFQLDGDVLASTTTNYGGHSQSFDWDSFFNSSGLSIYTSFPNAAVPGFTASGFERDFKQAANGAYDTSDNTTYTQGSKDIDNVNAWVCTAANNVTNKGDIQNAYAVAYTDPVSTHQFLYFALERNFNQGDANVAFWFLQDGTANCDASNGTANFTGNHADGDLFVVSAFTKGGVVSTINAYRWNGGPSGSLGTTAVASGGDCTATTPPAPLGDPACATANKQTISNIPWLTNNNGRTNGTGHSLLTSEFFEGGVDLTQSGLSGKCFNTFVADTRSSQSFTATLYDFARGVLGECKSTTMTTPTPAAGSSGQIPANAQVTSSDSAHITVSGGVAQFSGTVDFYICGPSVAAGANCQTGGDLVSQATLTDATSPQDVSSDSVTLTEVGKYCWRAVYSGDSVRGVPGSSDPADATNQSECFSITPRTPSLATCSGTFNTTTGVCTAGGTVDFGSAVSDRAHLTGTANEKGTGGIGSDGSINPVGGNGPATGNITFKLYKADCTTLAAGFPSAGLTAAVSGDGYYGPVSYTPTEPGTYYWDASYPGDSPNTLAATDTTACPSDDEKVIVRRIDTSISTHQSAYPNDSATITSTAAGDNLPAGGTVIFRLYQATVGGNSALLNCQAHGGTVGQGGLIYTETKSNVGGTHTATTGTTNTSVSVDVNGTYYWRVTYATGDQLHTGRQSDCIENTVLTFNNDPGPGTIFP